MDGGVRTVDAKRINLAAVTWPYHQFKHSCDAAGILSQLRQIVELISRSLRDDIHRTQHCMHVLRAYMKGRH